MMPRMSLRRMMAQGGQEVREQLERAHAQRQAAAEGPADAPGDAIAARAPDVPDDGQGTAGNSDRPALSGQSLLNKLAPPAAAPIGSHPSSAPRIRSVQGFGRGRPAVVEHLVTSDLDIIPPEHGLSSAEVKQLVEVTPREDLHALADSLAETLGIEAGYGTGPTLAEAIDSGAHEHLVFLESPATDAEDSSDARQRLSVDVRDVALFAAAAGEGESHLLNALIAEMALCKASDLHIVEGQAPAFRIGNLIQRIHHDPITKLHVLTLLKVLLKPEHFAEMEARSRRLEEQLNAAGTDVMAEMDVMYEDPRTGTRYRCNIAAADGAYALAIRALPKDVIPLRELGLPRCTEDIPTTSHGLIVVAGATGAGKTTTLASILDDYAGRAFEKIVTLEDPIEYHFSPTLRSIVVQRQIGRDTFTYATGVRSALRQDPDVIVVAETRDTETLVALLEAAQTGHLCLTTLHAGSAADAIRRMIEMFDANKRGNIAAQLSGVLRQVYFQVACPQPNGGVLRLFEAVPVTDAVAANIAAQQFHELNDSCRRAALENWGLTLEQAVSAALKGGSVDPRVAISLLPAEARKSLTINMGRF